MARERFDLPQDRGFAARLDELALMGRDRAEVTAAEAAPVRGDRKLDHVVGRDALASVAGVRQPGERKVVDPVHLFGGQHGAEKDAGQLRKGAVLAGLRHLDHGHLAHAGDQQICAALFEDRRLYAVVPIVVVPFAPQRSFNAADNHGDIGP